MFFWHRKTYSSSFHRIGNALHITNAFSINIGGLAVAVPGELRGYRELYERFGGNLPWAELLEPAIKLCEEGHLVNWHMARALKFNAEDIKKEPSMR